VKYIRSVQHYCAVLQMKKGEKLPLLPVWVVDLDTMTWTSLATTGDIPTARGGHSVSSSPAGTQSIWQLLGSAAAYLGFLAACTAVSGLSLTCTSLCIGVVVTSMQAGSAA
jgi:hypothetical protein